MTPEQFDRLVAANMTTEQIGVVMKMLAAEGWIELCSEPGYSYLHHKRPCAKWIAA